MKIKYVFIITLFLFLLSSCKEKNEQPNTTNSDYDLKKKELELKEKELDLKEKEMKNSNKNEQENKNKEKINQNKDAVDLEGMYGGTIKDGTSWMVYITSFKANTFKGHNEVYWKSTPGGFKTNFTGIYDPNTREILMYEDKNAKGSGLFKGKLSEDGNSMSGTWNRYTDNGSFTWTLTREYEEIEEDQ